MKVIIDVDGHWDWETVTEEEYAALHEWRRIPDADLDPSWTALRDAGEPLSEGYRYTDDQSGVEQWVSDEIFKPDQHNKPMKRVFVSTDTYVELAIGPGGYTVIDSPAAELAHITDLETMAMHWVTTRGQAEAPRANWKYIHVDGHPEVEQFLNTVFRLEGPK